MGEVAEWMDEVVSAPEDEGQSPSGSGAKFTS